MGPSWAVVATVDEPAPLIAAFVAHHLNEGAAEVHLFLDRPNRSVFKALEALPADLTQRLHVTRCNAEYWAATEFGRHPYLHTRRQIINAQNAYDRSKADWLLHCDADEFVRSGRILTRELALVDPGMDHMRLNVAERVLLQGAPQQGIFDGVFRLPAADAKRKLNEIYHPVAGFLDRGLTGHPNGKGLVRVGRGHQMGIHYPQGNLPSGWVRGTRLLHFDGLTLLHYLIKLLRRANEKHLPGEARHKPGRATQLTAMAENLDDPAFCREMLLALKTLRPEQAAALAAMEVLGDVGFVPSLGGQEMDLSVASFDAELREMAAKFLTERAPIWLTEPVGQP